MIYLLRKLCVQVDSGFLWVADGDGDRCVVQRWWAGGVSRFVVVLV